MSADTGALVYGSVVAARPVGHLGEHHTQRSLHSFSHIEAAGDELAEARLVGEGVARSHGACAAPHGGGAAKRQARRL